MGGGLQHLIGLVYSILTSYRVYLGEFYSNLKAIFLWWINIQLPLMTVIWGKGELFDIIKLMVIYFRNLQAYVLKLQLIHVIWLSHWELKVLLWRQTIIYSDPLFGRRQLGVDSSASIALTYSPYRFSIYVIKGFQKH